MALLSVLLFLAIAALAVGAGYLAGRFCPWFYLALIISPLLIPAVLLLSGSKPYGAFGAAIWTLFPSIGGCVWGRSTAKRPSP